MFSRREVNSLSSVRVLIMKTLKYALDSGQLLLNINKEVMPFDDLVAVGERINPKRPFIFVSKVIGRYVPTSLKTLNKVATQLANEVPLTLLQETTTTVISLSETALGLGALVHKALLDKNVHNLNVFTTRHRSFQEVLCGFQETHSHLPNHYVYKSSDDTCNQHLFDTETLILVDDEITTGNTLRNLYESLNLPNVKKVILLSLTDWSGKTFDDWNVDVYKYSLIEGSYSWEKSSEKPKELPYNPHKYADSLVLNLEDSFRLPTFDLFANYRQSATLEKDQYVIYYNELLPYCLQQYMQFLDSDKDVYFLSLSSSPIELSSSITSKTEFQGFYSSVPVYLYNFEDIVTTCNKGLGSLIVVSEPNHIPFAHF